MKRSVLNLLFVGASVLPAVSDGQDSAREVDVRDYDTIQGAVDALAGAGGVVYFPPGEYEVKRPGTNQNRRIDSARRGTLHGHSQHQH